MNENTGYLSWVFASVAAVVSTLAAAVAGLWRASEIKNAAAIERLEVMLAVSDERHRECLDDRDAIKHETTDLKVRVARLEAAAGDGGGQ